MVSTTAAKFIIEGNSGQFSCLDARIEISNISGEMYIDIVTKHSRIFGNLLDASVDEFGELSLILPDSEIKLPIEVAA